MGFASAQGHSPPIALWRVSRASTGEAEFFFQDCERKIRTEHYPVVVCYLCFGRPAGRRGGGGLDSFTYVKHGENWLIVDHHSSAMPQAPKWRCRAPTTTGTLS